MDPADPLSFSQIDDGASIAKVPFVDLSVQNVKGSDVSAWDANPESADDTLFAVNGETITLFSSYAICLALNVTMPLIWADLR